MMWRRYPWLAWGHGVSIGLDSSTAHSTKVAVRAQFYTWNVRRFNQDSFRVALHRAPKVAVKYGANVKHIGADGIIVFNVGKMKVS